eukprot:scaffold330238_cov59-Tisochrysis_lutea.AAC.6
MSSSSDRAHDVLAIAQDVVLLYSLLGGMPRLLSTLDGDEYVEGPEGEEGKALVAHVFTDPLRQVGKISVTAAARRRGSGEIASTTQPTNGITVDANFERFRGLVSAAVDLEALARHEYLIRPHFDAGLAELGEQRDQVCVARVDASLLARAG